MQQLAVLVLVLKVEVGVVKVVVLVVVVLVMVAVVVLTVVVVAVVVTVLHSNYSNKTLNVNLIKSSLCYHAIHLGPTYILFPKTFAIY